MRFEIHPDDLIEIYNRTEERGEEIALLYHSHPRSEAYPSQTDINQAAGVAAWWPDVVWAICSLAGEEPAVRAFEIRDGAAEEVELVVDG
jgi:proteasome lid subunit RPN8/RPN11